MPWSAPKHCPAGHPPFSGRYCPVCNTKRKATFDQKRPTARQRGYDSRWEKTRAGFLRAHSDCVRCGEPASLVDHIKPHRGDWSVFWDPTNWQALCTSCHSKHKQSEERQGERRRWSYSIPSGVRPSAIPVMLVCGPPGSGRSAYVEARAAAEDVVIDLAAIRAAVGGRSGDAAREAFARRDALLRGLADARQGRAWLIVTAPTGDERDEWRQALGAVTIVVMTTPKEECLDRVRRDPDRASSVDRQLDAIERWFTSAGGVTR